MSEPAFRRALPADAEAVTWLIERAIRISTADAYPADAVEAWATGRTAEAVRTMIEVTDGFVATVGDAVVGWANLDGDEVGQLYVDPDAGGQGVARRLNETVEALARANGLDQLTAVASLRAEPAFRRFGFRQVDTDQVAFNGQTFTVVRMAKHLDRSVPARRSSAGMGPAAASPALITTRPAYDDGWMSDTFPSPTMPASSRSEVFVGYLDYFRDRVVDKVGQLGDHGQRSSRLRSGWTPLELVKHLSFVELRWLEWGFAGRQVDDPWGDHRDGRWYVSPDETADQLLSALRAQGERSRAIIEANDLNTVGQPGPRWDGADPATLERVLFHLLQEYARHLGHLDVVVELADGPLGE